MRAWPDWSAAAHLELMDRTGIDTAVLSVSSPGTHFGDDQAAARALAREVNDAGGQIVRDHPGRFGLFASLPLPDTDGALAAIGYAFDTLGADGVILETNAHGVYLGDQRLEPVFAELARRRATVLLHPTSPPCWQQTALGRPRPTIEFVFDTARAVTNLILAGTPERHPELSVIVPHGGGACRCWPTASTASCWHPRRRTTARSPTSWSSCAACITTWPAPPSPARFPRCSAWPVPASWCMAATSPSRQRPASRRRSRPSTPRRCRPRVPPGSR